MILALTSIVRFNILLQVDTVGDGKADHYYDSTEGRLVAITEVNLETTCLKYFRVAANLWSYFTLNVAVNASTGLNPKIEISVYATDPPFFVLQQVDTSGDGVMDSIMVDLNHDGNANVCMSLDDSNADLVVLSGGDDAEKPPNTVRWIGKRPPIFHIHYISNAHMITALHVIMIMIPAF